jgi:hypothetical protein
MSVVINENKRDSIKTLTQEKTTTLPVVNQTGDVRILDLETLEWESLPVLYGEEMPRSYIGHQFITHENNLYSMGGRINGITTDKCYVIHICENISTDA